MKRCSPAEVRKSLILVEGLKSSGVGFIPIPYSNDEERRALIIDMHKRTSDIIKAIERNNNGT